MSACHHGQVVTFSNALAPGLVLWACADCRIRFYPHDDVSRAAPLDAAWRAAEAALPEGWHLNVDSGGADGPRAHACPEVMGTAVFVDADGDTPVAALQAIAARLAAKALL